MADVKFSCAKSGPAFCAAPGFPLWELEGGCGFEHWVFSGCQLSRKELGRFFLPQQRDGPLDEPPSTQLLTGSQAELDHSACLSETVRERTLVPRSRV